MKAGDTMAFYSPCGGGYGDPLERPAETVLDDVLDGFCTRAYAERAYGVVIAADLTLDLAATTARRAEMGAAR
jgi:N-methylhydantoinase B